METNSVPELIAASNNDLRLSNGDIDFTLEFLPPTRRRAKLGKTKDERFTPNCEANLHFENITGKGVPPIYDVYLNLPNNKSAQTECYAGSLPFYGLEESSTPSLQHDGKGQCYIIEVSDLIRYLRSQSNWSDKHIKITLMPTRDLTDDASVTVGRVSLYFRYL